MGKGFSLFEGERLIPNFEEDMDVFYKFASLYKNYCVYTSRKYIYFPNFTGFEGNCVCFRCRFFKLVAGLARFVSRSVNLRLT